MGIDSVKAKVTGFFGHLAADLVAASALTNESYTWWYPLSGPADPAIPEPASGPEPLR